MNNFAKIFEVNNYQVLIMISQDDEGEACISIKSRSSSGITGSLNFSPNDDVTIEDLFEQVATYEMAVAALEQFNPMFDMDFDEEDIDE